MTLPQLRKPFFLTCDVREKYSVLLSARFSMTAANKTNAWQQPWCDNSINPNLCLLIVKRKLYVNGGECEVNRCSSLATNVHLLILRSFLFVKHVTAITKHHMCSPSILAGPFSRTHASDEVEDENLAWPVHSN